MAKQALDRFKSLKKDADSEEQALLTALLGEAFPAYESYEDVPWTDLDSGAAILAFSVAPMCSAVARRVQFICSKETYNSSLCWAGYETEPDFHHIHLFRLVLKRLVRKKVDYDSHQLALLVAAAFGSMGQMPRATVLGHVERGVAKQALGTGLRSALRAAAKNCRDQKLEVRIAAVLQGKPKTAPKREKVLFRKPDPWAAKAEKDVAESSAAAEWKQLLQHCISLKTAQPSQKWTRESRALVDQIGQADFVDRMVIWLRKVPQFSEKDRQGHRSAESYEAGNATLLRGLVWSLPSSRQDLAAVLHKTALGCAKKVPDFGPRSTVVANACYGKLGELGSNEALQLLFDLRYNTNYSTLVRSIDRAIAGVAEARGSNPEALEKEVGARAASEARMVSGDEEGPKKSADLISEIYKNPRDQGLRAVYADALSEAGDPQGEFIVLQMQESQTREQHKREVALYKKHRRHWLGPLQEVVRSGGLVYRAGFPAEGRLEGEKHAELHSLAGHPAWATFEKLDADGQYERAGSAAFFSQPVLRTHLRELTGLHIDNLLAIATDKSSWALTTLGLSTFTNAERISSAQRDAIGAAEAIPQVRGFAIDPGNDDPSDWQWLLDSKLGQRLNRLEVVGAETVWVRVGALLMSRMEELLLRPDRFFGGCKYLFERAGDKINLNVKVSNGEKYHVEQVEAAFASLTGTGLSTLKLTVPKGPGRTKASIKRLAKLCDAMKLDSYRLPKV